MEHVLNLQAVSRQMKNKPQINALYHFFYGRAKCLNPEQIKEMKKIIVKEHKEIVVFLDESLKESKKKD